MHTDSHTYEIYPCVYLFIEVQKRMLVCAYMYSYVYIYIYMYVHIKMYADILGVVKEVEIILSFYLFIDICTQIYTYIFIYICVYIYIYMYIYIYAYMYMHLNTCI
jgi:hypothetical protein